MVLIIIDQQQPAEGSRTSLTELLLSFVSTAQRIVFVLAGLLVNISCSRQ